MNVGIAACQHRRPTRRAQRVRAEGVLEPHTLVGKPVHVGCLEDRVPRAAHLLRLLVVGHDEQNVGARVIGSGAATRHESCADRAKASQSLSAGRFRGSRVRHYRTSVPNATLSAALNPASTLPRGNQKLARRKARSHYDVHGHRECSRGVRLLIRVSSLIPKRRLTCRLLQADRPRLERSSRSFGTRWFCCETSGSPWLSAANTHNSSLSCPRRGHGSPARQDSLHPEGRGCGDGTLARIRQRSASTIRSATISATSATMKSSRPAWRAASLSMIGQYGQATATLETPVALTSAKRR